MQKLLTLLMVSAAVPVAAQTADTFELPEGCSAYLTIQTEACSVDHIFTCEGDAEGTQRRAAIGQNGLSGYYQIDAETQWLESVDIFAQEIERLSENVTDPASISELVETGIDTYDFTTESDETGQTRYVGFDSLTGNQVTIDDVLLDETEYNITAYDAAGDVLWQSKGNEYISQRYGMFLSGTSEVTVDGETFTIEDHPVEFIYEGEPGFLSANPKYGCGASDASAPSLIQRLEALQNEL